MSGLELTLVIAALLIGATGTWSPCGFSMIETLGPGGHAGGPRTTIAACTAFLPGALLGGIATFGGLALLGQLAFGAAGTLAYAIAAGLALTAALAEARGVRIVPQIRRQLPEHWRRVMPMPLAAGLYGVLLGLGFTTFVLTFGVWALAAISLAAGDPALGLWTGIGFGVGRALPVIAIAPIAARPLGWRAKELMAEGTLYRGFRLGDAVALLAASAVLAGQAGDAGAASPAHVAAADPSAQGGALAFQRQSDRRGVLKAPGKPKSGLPGTDPALSKTRIAVIHHREQVQVLHRGELAKLATFAAPGVDAVAISGSLLVYRTRSDGTDRLAMRELSASGEVGSARRLAVAHKPEQLGRPSVSSGRIAYAFAGSQRNKIIVRRPGARPRAVLRSVRMGLSNPALLGKRLAYVETGSHGDTLRIRSLKGHGSGRSLYRAKRLWSTALSKRFAYVTVLKGRRPSQRIVRVAR